MQRSDHEVWEQVTKEQGDSFAGVTSQRASGPALRSVGYWHPEGARHKRTHLVLSQYFFFPKQCLRYDDIRGWRPGPLWTQDSVSSETPSTDQLAAGLAERGRRVRVLIHGAPHQCLDMEMCVPAGPADYCKLPCVKSARFFPKNNLSFAFTSLKCKSWFEKVLTSTICHSSLNNLHFKANMAFIACLISHEHEKDAGFLLNKNVFIHQMTSKGEFLF